jgi:3-isopropylmalate/(R)-2-methylmalate dehydratase small subunit
MTSVFEHAVRGRAWTIGDSVDTNQLAGGGVEGATPEETLRINCLRGMRPEFADSVRPGDILITGLNFGCGSGRQTAIEALRLCGVEAVLAESVARIFRRNAIALAYPVFAVGGISRLARDGDEVEIDYPGATVRNLKTGMTLCLSPLPPSVRDIYDAGGIAEVTRRKLGQLGFIPS